MNEIELSNSRQIARAAMSWPFEPKEIANHVDRAEVVAAIKGFKEAMIPAKQKQRAQIIEEQKELAKLIGQIGNIINPNLSDRSAKEWAMNIVDALSILPIRIALAAARDAKHQPINFFNEVHPLIVTLSKPHESAYRLAISNLERLLREIDNPQKRIEKQSPAMSHEELQEMSEPLRRIGISAGWLKDDDGCIRWATDAEQAEHERAIARARNVEGKAQ